MIEDGFADTNMFVRLFTGDDLVKQRAVADYFNTLATEDGRLYLLPSTISEVVFVLRGGDYKYEHAQLARMLDSMLELPLVIVDRPIVERAIRLYESVHKDWDDCLIAAYALHQTAGVVLSFDYRLGRIPGITRIEP